VRHAGFLVLRDVDRQTVQRLEDLVVVIVVGALM